MILANLLSVEEVEVEEVAADILAGYMTVVGGEVLTDWGSGYYTSPVQSSVQSLYTKHLPGSLHSLTGPCSANRNKIFHISQKYLFFFYTFYQT